MGKVLLDKIWTHFDKEFNSEPLLVFAPGRINLIGEHTDYNNGFVLPAAIDKGIYLAIGKSNTKTSKLIAYDLNEEYEFITETIRPIPNGNWKNYILGVIDELRKAGHEIKPINIVFAGTIPIGAGLSSSAALENAVAFGLNTLLNLKLTKEEMILISQKAEHNFVGVQCGIMDQYASMFGEENCFLLLDCKTIKAQKHFIDFEDNEIVLVNSNVSHNLAESAYNDRRAACERIANTLNVTSLRDVSIERLESNKMLFDQNDYLKALYVLEENKRVIKATKAIKNNDHKLLGSLLFKSHEGLSQLYNVSCDELDFLVKEAQDNSGILGARMMGGGFGGCTINLIKKAAVPEFKSQLLLNYNNKFNKACTFYNVKTAKGTHIINSL